MSMRIPQSNTGLNAAILQCSPPPAEGTWHRYQCTLVTPMYGGGVKAGEVDMGMPIRAAAIRGQLRFWWRIACGPFPSSQEMFRQENAIWGGIGGSGATASKVEVSLVCAPVEGNQLLSSNAETSAELKYAFGSAAINGAAHWLAPGYTFELNLRYPEDVAVQVLDALKWWATFGGVGARTRRGFGAMHIEGVPSCVASDVAAKEGQLIFAGNPSPNAYAAWSLAINRLYSFRQRRGIGRGIGAARPGRSFWPEADQLRRFTGRNANGRHLAEHPAGNSFPRAAFGLPITFEFRGERADPPRMELQPSGNTDRMASPLILRPYWNGALWQSAALLLPGWEKALTQGLKFKSNHHTPNHWPGDPGEQIRIAMSIRPMQSQNHEPRANDPLSAFMNYFNLGH